MCVRNFNMHLLYQVLEVCKHLKNFAEKIEQTDLIGIDRVRVYFCQMNISFLLSATRKVKLRNNKKGRKMNRGKVLHASFHFESRSSMALNAGRVASIRPNGTFADAQKENKRKEGKEKQRRRRTSARYFL